MATISIDPQDATPIYAQIERALRAAIATGRMQPGDQLPTVRQLAVDLRVNANTVAKLGGKPATPKPSYDFPVQQLKSQADVLRFAARLEQGAVSAYLGAVPLFGNPDLAKAAASILGDEAMHWAVLRQAIGETPVPSAFVS